MGSDRTAEKVFGIGMHKTGTSTLGSCLKTLGYTPTISHNLEALKYWRGNDLEKLWPIIDVYRGFEDWPWPLMYQQLYERYPNSKFILTKRLSTEKWYSSLAKHAKRYGPTEHRKLVYGYGMPEENKPYHLNFYEQHNREVMDFFQKNAPEKLLVVCWERGDNWTQLCDFLKKPQPNEPFPHLNQHQFGWWRTLRRKVSRMIRN